MLWIGWHSSWSAAHTKAGDNIAAQEDSVQIQAKVNDLSESGYFTEAFVQNIKLCAQNVALQETELFGTFSHWKTAKQNAKSHCGAIGVTTGEIAPSTKQGEAFNKQFIEDMQKNEASNSDVVMYIGCGVATFLLLAGSLINRINIAKTGYDVDDAFKRLD